MVGKANEHDYLVLRESSQNAERSSIFEAMDGVRVFLPGTASVVGIMLVAPVV